ncbi:MAG: hypothetical protein KGI70_00320 [Patescibacteria group bacterium]|nr:hypothetical protein [Patescibacteria group bacterium]
MDIEKLTKHQIVLLTLLVSFVTSIATGIVTVALINQVPPQVRQTINQIVEHTVEQVAQAPAAVVSSATGGTITKQTTVVVKDDDQVALSIAQAQKGIVRIVSTNDPQTLLARGIIIDKQGTVLSDRGVLEPMGTLQFEAYLPDGKLVPAVMRVPQGTSTIAVLDLSIASSSAASIVPIALADSGKLALGSSVIRIGGSGGDTVGVGVIAKIPSAMSDAHRDLIESTVTSSTPGSVIITLFGDAVGLTTGDSSSLGSDFYTVAKVPPTKNQ